MRDHSKHIQLNRWEATEAALSHCSFSPESETVAVSEAIGRVLAVDAVAQQDMPNSLTCRMDSVAVRWDDFACGMPDTSCWKRGRDWEFANTGVGMPEGFDTAIVVEHVIFSEDDTRVEFDALPSERFAGTMPIGARMKQGDVLVPANTVITPLLAATIASGNNTSVEVVKRPRVSFIPTGNELVSAGGKTPLGKNIESNSLLVQAKVVQWGGEPVLFDIVPDERESIEAALRKAVACSDIVVINAGSSKGSDDFCLEVLEEMGTVLYHQTNHGPGHHSSHSIVEGVPVVGISGPPGGAAFTLDFYLYPIIARFLGQPTSLKRVRARLAEPFAGKDHPTRKAGAPLAGEQRPLEGGEFYSVRQMLVSQASDGVMEARPCGGSHPKPLQAEGASAYYFMPSGPGAKKPQVGDFIELEYRPGFGL